MRSTESDSREWYVEKLWIVPALALLLPPLAFVLTFSRLIPLGVFLPLLITLAVGMVTLLAKFILMMNGGANVKERNTRLAIFLALGDVAEGGIFAVLLFLAAPR